MSSGRRCSLLHDIDRYREGAGRVVVKYDPLKGKPEKIAVLITMSLEEV